MSAARRAERLLRCYPEEWRQRYGDEFTELLAADIAERPRSWGRTVDVLVGGTTARFAGAGLCGTTVDPADRSLRCLATFLCALAAFLTFAVSMWSHLHIAARWARPADSPTHWAIMAMTVAVVVCVAGTVLAVVPVAWTAVMTSLRRPDRGLRRPMGLFLGASFVLVGGAVLFRHGWSDGSHPWVHQSAGLDGPAGFMWASTMTVSAYWAHPSTLLSFPLTEIAWMVVSPLAVVLAVTGLARIVRRVTIPPGRMRWIAAAARAAVLGLVLFAVGTLMWLVDGVPGPGNAFQAGNVDFIGLAVTSVALVVAVRAVPRCSLTSPLPAR